MVNLTVPGVKIQEVATLPPSVAPVDTAIPAFIGYTALNGGKVKKVSSFLEFEQYFGGPELAAVTVALSTGNKVTDSTVITPSFTIPHYFMYYSVKAFYDNGGGDCYVSSAAIYKTSGPYVVLAELQAALTAISKEDQPTLLVLPEAINLGDTEYGTLYNDALTQCNDLKDRFAILDAYPTEKKESALLTFQSADDVDTVQGDYVVIQNNSGMKFAVWLTKTPVTTPPTGGSTPFGSADYKIMVTIDPATDTSPASVATKVMTAITTDASYANADFVITNETGGVLKVNHSIEGNASNPVAYVNAGTAGGSILVTMTGTEGDIGTTSSITLTRTKIGTSNLKYGAVYYPRLKTIYNIATSNGKITVSGSGFTTSTLEALINDTPDITGNPVDELLAVQIQAAVNAKLANSKITIGASGAIAGIYAQVDASRGVWKAPANISINAISGPTILVNDDLQGTMNVDATSGKSINAIRPFVGVGTLVWGARTLAGNDNEWRYINVRRLMIFIEESCQKASSQFVFEPNTAQTWQRLKGMIDGFLTNLWRQGALAGAKPEEAFFVRVGIGSTMTAQDILDGALNVEIGIAPSRPAEFIVLKFSHKLQVS
jgi:uncharacterized protein